MALGKEIEKLKYDKRLLDANVSRGTVSKADKEKHLKELPDLASNVENLGLVRGGGSSTTDADYGDQNS